MDPSKLQLLTTSTSPAHYTNITHMYLQPLKPKHRPKCDSEGSKPQEHEAGVVGEDVRSVAMVGQPHTLDGVGHDGDGDEVEYNDKDKEPHPVSA